MRIAFISSVIIMLSSINFLTPLAADEIVNRNPQKIFLKSDNSLLDGKTRSFQHCGEALLTQDNLTLNAECLTGKQNKDGTFAYITAHGNPAILVQNNPIKNEKLTIKANLIEYKVSLQRFSIIGNASLELNGQSDKKMFIKADRIDLDNSDINKRDIDSSGKPLQIILSKAGKTDLKAESKHLHYNTGSSNLKLSKDVIANLDLRQISAGIFDYNNETKISSFKKSSDTQIEIIQTKKPRQ